MSTTADNDLYEKKDVEIVAEQSNRGVFTIMFALIGAVFVLCCVTLALVVDTNDKVDKLEVPKVSGVPVTVEVKHTGAADSAATPGAVSDHTHPVADHTHPAPDHTHPAPAVPDQMQPATTTTAVAEAKNPCEGKKPKHADANAKDYYFSNQQCLVEDVAQTLEQAGANVTKGYKGNMDAGDRVPILEHYSKEGLCPVNVHWHLGAEHLSVGEYDESGKGPSPTRRHSRRSLAASSEVRQGFQCGYYDASDPKFTKKYDWKTCTQMEIGQTYEIHWPHSAAGACGTEWQYQTPFYDGVFCRDGIISLSPLNTFKKIGVQAQIFTVVNDDTGAYDYDNLIAGMVVDASKGMGTEITKYTGSTTGTSRNNTVCSRYTPITWQVDRKCHLVSAKSFDKLCADMKAMKDDMSGDFHPHGARELVADRFAANNQQNRLN